jgi:MinD superfamily P-loop ATPase
VFHRAQSRPSTATRRQVATVDGQLCVRCGKCVQVCPVQAIAPDEEGYPLINANLCRGCAACADACPVQAIRLVPAQPSGEPMPRP